ncbi:glycosyltransferase family protein [Sphingomonas profundi]|uniref:glycosyltransferase family protein n=1 Tax=Alterirhizorhabdus profundi TaxID=2681549 RepID=UPI0012E7874A|nr:glycosyltransferase [Sphingomonas profundi]
MFEPGPDDIRQSYLFLLGREAEAEAITGPRATSSVAEIVASFMTSAEFEASVVAGLLEAGNFTAPLFQFAPPAALLEWAAGFLPLSARGAKRLPAARTWSAAFRTVFLDPVFEAEVLAGCGVDLPEAFIDRLHQIATIPLAEVEEVLLGEGAVTLMVVPVENAPVDYVPQVSATFSDGSRQRSISDLRISHSGEDGRHRIEVRYIGATDRVMADIQLDGDLLVAQVPLKGSATRGLDRLPGIGQVDHCGPLFISGWMKFAPGPRGDEYEVLIDGVPSGSGRVPAPPGDQEPRFLFALPKRFKDGRTHDVVVRRQADGAVLRAAESSFAIGIPALDAEWRQDGLMIRLSGDHAADLRPDQAKIIVTAGMAVIGEYEFRLAVGGRRLVSGVIIPATTLLPHIGSTLTATLPALLAEISVPLAAETLTGPLVGCVDGVDPNVNAVYGWCAFQGRTDNIVSLDVSVDGDALGTFSADLMRSDLAGLHGKGFHGFRIVMPEKYRDGCEHTIVLRDQLTGLPVPKSPFAFTLRKSRIVRPMLAPSVADRLSVARGVNLAPGAAAVRKRVTVVILTRNGGQVLDECLASIWKYTPAGLIDIVIVDHQSTDGTEAMIRRWKSKLTIDYHYVEGNNSFSFANNWAIDRFSDSEYVLLLNNDIILIEDVIGKMLRYLEEHEDVGLVGCKLLEARDRGDLTKASVHHLGIQLGLSAAGFVDAYETSQSGYIADQVAELPTYSVTGACAMMRRAEYLAIGGLEESYFYGGEDVELGEAVLADLGKKVVCLNNVAALHHRGWLRLSVRGAEGMKRVHQNSRVLRDRLGYQMRKRHARGLIDPDRRWASERARIGFVVVESGPVARTGEYFTAAEIGGALAAQFGVEVEFVQPDVNWHDARGLTHIVNMLHEYRISQVQSDRPNLMKIAWLRNNFEAWVQTGELTCYHMVWCSSLAFCRELERTHGIKALHVPIATNLEEMRSGNPAAERTTDVMFNGSHSGVARSFLAAFDDPAWHDKVAIYGHGWDKVPAARPMWRGFFPYAEMRNLYANARIVIDQAHESAAHWGGTNSRVFDAIAAGCLPLTNSSESSETDFQGLLPVWRTEKDLRDLVGHFLDREEDRITLVARLASLVEDGHQYRHRAETVATALLEASQSVRSVAIKIGAPLRAEAHAWGDTHLAEALAGALRRRGLYVQVQCIEEWNPPEHFDAALVMRGLSRYTPRGDELTLGWVISHPDAVSGEEVSLYDGVAFASQALADRHRGAATAATVARQFSIFDAEATETAGIDPASAALLEKVSAEDIVFVGNTRGKVRKFIIDIAQSLPIKVIGAGWDQYVPMDMVLGDYIDNAALPHLYGKAFAVLNDHWADMAEANILSNRVLDVVMSGGLVISDWNDEGAALVSEELFFKSAAGAVAALRRFRADPEARGRAIAVARRNVARRFDAETSADRIFDLLTTAHENRMAGSRRGRVRPTIVHQQQEALARLAG